MATLEYPDLEKVIDAFRLFPKEMDEELNSTAIEVGELLTVYGRSFHKWQHRDHNLEKDINYRVFNRKDGVSISYGLGFYPSQTRVFWSARNENVSYGTILHEGAFNDPWIDESYEKNETKVQNKFINAVNNVIKKVF